MPYNVALSHTASALHKEHRKVAFFLDKSIEGMQTILPSNAASEKGQGSDSNYFLLLAQKETITKFTTDNHRELKMRSVVKAEREEFQKLEVCLWSSHQKIQNNTWIVLQ